MTDFKEQAEKAAAEFEYRQKRARPLGIDPNNECVERQCDLCPFVTKTRCRAWMATRVYK